MANRESCLVVLLNFSRRKDVVELRRRLSVAVWTVISQFPSFNSSSQSNLHNLTVEDQSDIRLRNQKVVMGGEEGEKERKGRIRRSREERKGKEAKGEETKRSKRERGRGTWSGLVD